MRAESSRPAQSSAQLCSAQLSSAQEERPSTSKNRTISQSDAGPEFTSSSPNIHFVFILIQWTINYFSTDLILESVKTRRQNQHWAFIIWSDVSSFQSGNFSDWCMEQFIVPKVLCFIIEALTAQIPSFNDFYVTTWAVITHTVFSVESSLWPR